MKNKILDGIGYKESCYNYLMRGMKNDKRRHAWKKQRKKYGGNDERITWCLGDWIVESLYTWLTMYLKFAGKVIDLSFHKFTINGKVLTEEECINRILKDLHYILLHSESTDEQIRKKCKKCRKDAFMVLAEVLPALGW